MKTIIAIVFISGVNSILFCNCFAQNKPPRANSANRIVQKFIEPKQDWTNTGVIYHAGQKVGITASGILNWFTGGCNGKCISSPDGLRKDQVCPPTRKTIIAPNLKCYSLIGRIGGGEPFEVGSCFNGIAQTLGELQLGVNDEYFDDNSIGWHAMIGAEPPNYGDVIIYWQGGSIVHSGIVTQVDGCKVTRIQCFIQTGPNLIIANAKSCTGYLGSFDPDDPLLHEHFGNIWTIYHSDDLGAIPLKKTAPNSSQALTERFSIICLTTDPACGKNCHGYTFMNNFSLGIMGYGLLENKTINCHTSQGTVDQGTAVEIILRDNGYRQVFAQGLDGGQHFDEKYSVGYFVIP